MNNEIFMEHIYKIMQNVNEKAYVGRFKLIINY